jgi:NAD(P)-dependent dehydrogenase (short-subunit alcohol dehydrogenase family)
MKLDGRIAVVSGAFRGIGKASAEILATEGAHVIALGIIDGEPVYASRIAYRRFDVASPQMWDDLAKELERIDILVNSAGITLTRSGLTDLDLSEWNRIIVVAVLLLAALLVLALALAARTQTPRRSPIAVAL